MTLEVGGGLIRGGSPILYIQCASTKVYCILTEVDRDYELHLKMVGVGVGVGVGELEDVPILYSRQRTHRLYTS